MMALLSLAFVACDDDYATEVGPQSNPQEKLLQLNDVSVTTGVQTINISDLISGENGEEPITIGTVILNKENLPANAVLTADVQFATDENFENVITVRAQDFNENYDINVTPSVLQDAYFNGITRNPATRPLYVRTILYAMTAGESVAIIGSDGIQYFDTHIVNLTPLNKVKISQNYYIVGGPNDWATSAAERSIKFNHSDADVYDDPVFTVTFAANEGDTWFAIGDDEACDAIGNGDTIRAEHMLDLELGYQIQRPSWNFSINGYAMLYKDQMTPSGDISSSGYALMENIEKSYRLGVEPAGGVKATDWLRFDANLTLSLNRAIDVTFADFEDGDSINMVVSGTDTSWTTLNVTKTTPLALSPSVIGSAIMTVTPFKDAKLQLIGKYVGKQYIDNTGREVYAIDPYFLLGLRASYTWHIKGSKELEAQLLVNNLLNHNYRLGAWVGDWYDDWSSSTAVSYYHSVGYLQQPGRNFMARVVFRF